MHIMEELVPNDSLRTVAASSAEMGDATQDTIQYFIVPRHTFYEDSNEYNDCH